VGDAVAKIVDLQDEINYDIDRLVDLKRDMVRTIKKVDNAEYQTLLELRYLCFKTWEQIAVDMNYTIDNVYRIHRKALCAVRIPKSVQ
jgi:DNA-directed RNA polymerase specialized sigma subunit